MTMLRMNVVFTIRMSLVIVATSYLTLGVFDHQNARRLWWAYGLVVLVLSIANLICGRRRKRSGS